MKSVVLNLDEFIVLDLHGGKKKVLGSGRTRFRALDAVKDKLKNAEFPVELRGEAALKALNSLLNGEKLEL